MINFKSNKFYMFNLLNKYSPINLNENIIKLFCLGNKERLDILIPSREDSKWINEVESLLLFYFTSILGKTIYFGKYVSDKGEDSIFFSKKLTKNLLVTDKDYDLKLGLSLSIPKCCVRKYCEENGKIQSYNSAKRYLQQCKEMKIKHDVFEINLSHNGAFCEKFGFIPCSPKCKKALKIVKKLEKIDKLLEKKI